ncbi:MAG TPA: GAF domain-containing sensor histidine kinase [Solirubrobacterales bacterium]|nr:GAF domain-containing sensor histidine kinase [Solirubrobacterales bacterium]
MNPPNRSDGAEERSARLIDVGTTLLADLDLESVLRSVVEAARELTGAEYAALGVLDRDHKELERFIYLGIDDETKRSIGNLPRGLGVLGELIREPSPLRLRDVNQHAHAYGFPPGHPPMHSFLGVPIRIRDEVYGNLYMTEKRGAAEFDEADEEAARTLATWAGVAIENARLYTALSEREAVVERALRQAETSVDIARAVGGETDVARVLDLIVKRARALVEAKALLVLLRQGGRLVVAGQAGEVGPEIERLTIPTEDSVFEAAMQERVAQHLERGSPPSEARLRERVGAETALVVPLLFRGRAVGVLVALDRETGGTEFDEEDLRLLQAFAASAAVAVATAQTVESERLQQRVEIGERERQRWARELHDETLQGLAAIRISLATALQSGAPDRPERIAAAAEQTVDRLEGQINELSRLINDLRPASLERLGLAAALQALAEEAGARGGFEVAAEIELDGELSGEEERVVYRLAQEALNNVVKHSAARHATLSAKFAGGAVRIVVADDGAGFEAGAESEGRGLIGMRERVALLGGEFAVRSRSEGGTEVVATLPLGSP